MQAGRQVRLDHKRMREKEERVTMTWSKGFELPTNTRIKKLHKETGLSLDEDAKRIHIHPTTFRSYYYGINFPGVKSIALMCKRYDVDADYLIGLSDVRRRYGE